MGSFAKTQNAAATQISSADLPIEPNGKLYHLGISAGQINNLIITVGELERAKLICSMFDEMRKEHKTIDPLSSSRGFHVFNGHYEGIPVSIVVIGMGYPMMDFFVREVRAITTGELCIVRLGSCGSLKKEVTIGNFAIASKGSKMVVTDFDEVGSFTISKTIMPDAELTKTLTRCAQKSAPGACFEVRNATCDTFYATQGRFSPHFLDKNERIIGQLRPSETGNDVVDTLEMETGYLFYAANLIKKKEEHNIRTAALMIVYANRSDNQFLVDAAEKIKLQKEAGKICLETLLEFAKNNLH